MRKETLTFGMITCLALAGLLLLAASCGGDDAASMKEPGPEPEPPSQKQPVIEESDLYKADDLYLYVQNQYTGLNIIDTSNPSKPRLVGRAPTSGGAGGELYIQPMRAIVLLKAATSACISPKGMEAAGWPFGAEVVFVDLSSRAHPKVMVRYCVPGKLVASRTVDDVLYLITTRQDHGSRIISIDISDPEYAAVLQQRDFPNVSKEITVTAEQIMVAGPSKYNWSNTSVQYISIDNQGNITTRGEIEVEGQPQGRFHQHIWNNQFRIVTYDDQYAQSKLYVIDISNPDQLMVTGSLGGIGYGEKLYATRFTCDRAYVVTFRQTDPLWIISLADPREPRMMGELHVPGWSDFIFPRGNHLITVGRGDRGNGLGVSLFDVTDPMHPRSIQQITLGSADTQSEANVDHRGVTIVEVPGRSPLIVVPHTGVYYGSSCEIHDQLQLVEVNNYGLVVRGSVSQKGTIRRSVMIKSSLYSISDQEILALNITNRDNPVVDTAVTVGQAEYQSPYYADYCSNYYPKDHYYMEEDYDEGGYPFMFRCDVSSGTGLGLPPVTALLGLLWLGVWWSRRRKRS